MMKILQFIAEHAGWFLVLFAIGCAASLVRAFRRGLSAKEHRRLKFMEWCLFPPGFTAIFITLQQESVRHFALHPAAAIAACLGVAAGSTLLLLAKRRKRPVFLAWLGELLGIPGVIFSLILVGMYFRSPERFEKIRATHLALAAAKGVAAPDFAFTLLSTREEKRLADYRGNVVLLNIWATWCIPCLKEMPDLNELQRKFKSAGLVVINLSDESLEVIDQHLLKHPMITTHGRVEKRAVPGFYQFGAARPATFLIGRKGEVIATVLGAENLGYFEAILKPQL
ncbi:MAG TPA: TlpA disulfide reductase family protein [Opitutaceae bacterium]|nr:TlpA disulfide reductase family protein [Opitutaceae bacterium]